MTNATPPQSQRPQWLKAVIDWASNGFVLKNLLGILAIVLGFVVLVMLYLAIYTRHGSYVTVPSFVGKTVEQAEATKGSRHLRFTVVDSAQYSDTLEAGEIVLQDPPAGAKAKRGRHIYVTVNPYEPPMLPVPRLWDRQLPMAENALRRLRFEWTVTRVPDRATNTVLQVFYRTAEGKRVEVKRYGAGDEPPMIPYGAKLELVVAEGAGMAVGIPNLVCQTYTEAISTLTAAGLAEGAIVVSAGVVDTLAAYVWRQNPSAFEGGTISMGDPVDLYLQVAPVGCPEDALLLDESWNDEGEF